MYLRIGPEKSVLKSDVIGIFDLDKTTVEKNTRLFLNSAEKNGEAQTLSMEDMPLSFLVCDDEKLKHKVYISPVTVQTLNLRWNDKKRG